MQFTSKFILLAIALAYGGIAASAVPVAARSAEDLNAREIDDMKLFVRDPFTPTPTRSPGPPHTDAGLSVSGTVMKVKKGRVPRKGRGPRYDPKPTMDSDKCNDFRESANQEEIIEAAKNDEHPHHSTAIHMKQEEALLKDPELLERALGNPNHPLYKRASRSTATQEAALREHLKLYIKAYNDPWHVLHKRAKAQFMAQVGLVTRASRHMKDTRKRSVTI